MIPPATQGRENRPLIKVCGLTQADDVRLCLDLGVHYTGFVFAPKSPRFIKPEAAARLPRGAALRVGVFAGYGVSAIHDVMHLAGLDYAQLHGGEDDDFCRRVGPERVIKVFWPERLTAEELEREAARYAPVSSLFLLDAGASGGGSGQTLAWSRLQTFAPPRPWLLAGGLHPGNMRDALQACAPYALDCNSGLETRPGIKDEAKLRAATRIVSEAGAHTPSRSVS